VEDKIKYSNLVSKKGKKLKVNLLGLSKPELVKILIKHNLPKFRANQLWNWIYRSGVSNFNQMSNISKDLQRNLSEIFFISRPLIITSSQISDDGTIKWLLKLNDGNEIETVWIPDNKRGTLCISSQVGCTLTCKFCHTGTQRLVRNLTSAEIVGQVMLAIDELNDWPSASENRYLTSIVLMGMGEPLYNYENVKTALEIIMDHAGISLSRRRITLSTSGIIPEIDKCGKDLGVNLAISLHATDDKLRDQLVPINQKYNIKQLLEAVRSYATISNARRVTWEYVMLKGVNDNIRDAKNLVNLIKGIPSKINLIPFNEWPCAPYKCSNSLEIKNFAKIIMKAGYASPIRTPRGRDVMAACGQLKSLSKIIKKVGRKNLNSIEKLN
jgi:23S rRNA (adenine2503-C2)-methyltransferase